jgi:threonine/homoserine/homoserine lactone efflux protein
MIMTWYGLSVFGLVYVLAVATPGPGVAAVIARSLGHGLRGAPAFIAGFMVGDLIWFTFAATGLAMLVLPTVVELKTLSIAGFFEIVLVIAIALPAVLGGYAFGASRARRLFSTPKTIRWVQRGTGVAMASAAVAVATR